MDKSMLSKFAIAGFLGVLGTHVAGAAVIDSRFLSADIVPFQYDGLTGGIPLFTVVGSQKEAFWSDDFPTGDISPLSSYRRKYPRGYIVPLDDPTEHANHNPGSGAMNGGLAAGNSSLSLESIFAAPVSTAATTSVGLARVDQAMQQLNNVAPLIVAPSQITTVPNANVPGQVLVFQTLFGSNTPVFVGSVYDPALEAAEKVAQSTPPTPISTPPITVPPVTTPPVTTPPVTIPPVTVSPTPISTPPITVPPVTTPPVTIPPVTVSPTPISTPPITVPPVTTPPVTVPPVTVLPTSISTSLVTDPTAATSATPTLISLLSAPGEAAQPIEDLSLVGAARLSTSSLFSKGATETLPPLVSNPPLVLAVSRLESSSPSSAGSLALVSDGMDQTESPAVVYAVPEPQTWVMMLIGFSGLGFLGLRRLKSTRGA